MENTGTAYFIQRPRTKTDLLAFHPLGQEQSYEIAKVVYLKEIDYENFTADMLVDRDFIEEYASLCERGETWRCLLVLQEGQEEGVLVMPERECFVGWAAYYVEAWMLAE